MPMHKSKLSRIRLSSLVCELQKKHKRIIWVYVNVDTFKLIRAYIFIVGPQIYDAPFGVR